jgi:hypothetical protein
LLEKLFLLQQEAAQQAKKLRKAAACQMHVDLLPQFRIDEPAAVLARPDASGAGSKLPELV